MEAWMQDFKYAFRSIGSAKKFAATAIGTLALGIGANTAVFGVLHAVVLRPLPYEQPEQLVRVYETINGEDNYLEGPAALALRERSQTLDLALLYTYSVEGADLTDGPRPERVQTLQVSADYFRVLRVTPARGRVFDRADERPGSHVAVVSARIWREHLGGAEDATDRFLTLNGIPHHVVAVLPDGFRDPLEPDVDVWTAIDLQRAARAGAWGNFYLSAVGRLQNGATLAQAQAEIATIAASLSESPAKNDVHRSAWLVPLQTDTAGSTGPLLWILLGAVGLLLIIACVNVASLFLARGGARQPELAVRAALGCSRWRLVRQLLVESLVLSMTGGLVGLVLARLVTGALLAAAPETVARIASPLDAAVLAFSAGAALVAGLGFGVAPALQATRASLDGLLRESSRRGSPSRRQTRARNALVMLQIALALVLVISAGLLLRSFERLRTVTLGMQPANVLVFQVNLPSGRYADPQRRAHTYRELEKRLTALPGVHAAGATSRLPATGRFHTWLTRRLDLPPETRDIHAEQRVIEGAYFQALHIPLLRGRTFTDADDEHAPRRVVVSQSLARELFGNEDPIGRTLRATGDAPQCEIIGVVGDVAVTSRGTIAPTVYHAHRQFAANRNWSLTQVVALDRPMPSLVNDVRRTLDAIDPGLVLYRPGMLTDVIGSGIAQERFALLLIGAFALLALVLAAVGVYGVLSYAVSRRRREMGIRMALGAPARVVSALVVRDGARLAAAGVLLGLAGAYVATRALRSLLFNVAATDPMVFAAAAAALALIALAASWIPARAATRVDPLDALRADNQ
jgi:putative ABC transport system permease protein